jgi:DJ-1 family protein
MTKYVLVPIAHGTEEMEAVIIIDILRRAGITVKVAGDNEIVTCSRGVKIIPDELIDNLDINSEFDAIILPGGGKGTDNLMNNYHLSEILKSHRERGALIAAICAAPTILSEFKILKPESKITSHPSVRNRLEHYNYIEEKVVFDDNIVTSRGAGTAFMFALFIVELLMNSDTAKKVACDIILD